MKKEVIIEDGKKHYLVGIFNDGSKAYLVEGELRMDSYWHFGDLKGKDNSFYYRDIFNTGYYKISSHPNIKESILTTDEEWRLSELMKAFYILEDAARLLKIGSCGISKPGIDLKNPYISVKINKELVPKIFKAIDELLTPNPVEEKKREEYDALCEQIDKVVAQHDKVTKELKELRDLQRAMELD